jgi:magnesium transporter
MSKHRKKNKKNKSPGSPPGSLIFTGEKFTDNPIVLQVRFAEEYIETKKLLNGEMPLVNDDAVTWTDIRGLHDVALIESYGKQFNIHPLILEDIVNTQQRPKFEEYGNGVFIVVRSLIYQSDDPQLETEQIAIYLGKNYLLTFQENPDDTFTAVRERLEAGKGRIRSKKSDYLAYTLIDNVVDNYFEVLDHFEDTLDSLEQETTTNPSRLTKEQIHRMKFQLLTIRRAVLPLREAINRFSRAESDLIDTSTEVFVRDLYDHVIRITDIIETYREMAIGLHDLYLSELSHRMNNVIRVLTIITTIFVPLTFLAGVYGMNFENMPGLHHKYGYLIMFGLMLLITVFLLILFRKKKWI